MAFHLGLIGCAQKTRVCAVLLQPVVKDCQCRPHSWGGGWMVACTFCHGTDAPVGLVSCSGLTGEADGLSCGGGILEAHALDGRHRILVREETSWNATRSSRMFCFPFGSSHGLGFSEASGESSASRAGRRSGGVGEESAAICPSLIFDLIFVLSATALLRSYNFSTCTYCSLRPVRSGYL